MMRRQQQFWGGRCRQLEQIGFWVRRLPRSGALKEGRGDEMNVASAAPAAEAGLPRKGARVGGRTETQKQKTRVGSSQGRPSLGSRPRTHNLLHGSTKAWLLGGGGGDEDPTSHQSPIPNLLPPHCMPTTTSAMKGSFHQQTARQGSRTSLTPAPGKSRAPSLNMPGFLQGHFFGVHQIWML